MRVAGWQTKLNEYLLQIQEEYKQTGLVWGKLDCAHFAGNWVLLCTGEDPIADYRGLYSTEGEAFELLVNREGGFLAALTKRFGEPVHPSHAHRGDLAYHQDIEALGIFFTSGSRTHALFLGRGGFALHKASECTHAFRVGGEA